MCCVGLVTDRVGQFECRRFSFPFGERRKLMPLLQSSSHRTKICSPLYYYVYHRWRNHGELSFFLSLLSLFRDLTPLFSQAIAANGKFSSMFWVMTVARGMVGFGTGGEYPGKSGLLLQRTEEEEEDERATRLITPTFCSSLLFHGLSDVLQLLPSVPSSLPTISTERAEDGLSFWSRTWFLLCEFAVLRLNLFIFVWTRWQPPFVFERNLTFPVLRMSVEPSLLRFPSLTQRFLSFFRGGFLSTFVFLIAVAASKYNNTTEPSQIHKLQIVWR